MLEARCILLRLLTPTNCGAAEGSASVDRQTLREAATGLPCLPATTLKGIWRDRLDPTSANDVHGWGDDEARARVGRRSVVQLGEAFLLFLPIPTPGGGFFWMASALNLGRFFEIYATHVLPEDCRAIVKNIEDTKDDWGLIYPASLSALEIDSGGVITAFISDRRPGFRELIHSIRQSLPLGWAFQDGRPLALVSSPQASLLIPRALDIRAATALSEKGTAAEQSLRRTELLPEGTVFASLVSDQGKTKLPNYLLAGSGEGLGWGWIEISEIT